jgi:hypothetical protein
MEAVGDDGAGAPWSLGGRRRPCYSTRAGTVHVNREAAAGELGLALEAGNL